MGKVTVVSAVAVIGLLFIAIATPLFVDAINRAESNEPPSPSSPPSPPPGQPLKVLMITDWHTLPDYSQYVRAGGDCYCSNVTAMVQGGTDCETAEAVNGVYGQYGCDGPVSLVIASLDAAAAGTACSIILI